MHRMTQLCTSEGCKHESISSGFLYYYALTQNTFLDMVKQLIWMAKEEADCDAFSVQLLMDNKKEELEQAGFMTGDGRLHYYLVNWSVGDNEIGPNDMGAILV